MSLQEQQSAVIAVIVILGVMWLLRKQIARLLLRLIKHNLGESKQYIIEVIDKSIYNFVHYTLLTLIVYIFTIFFVQNVRLATIVDNIAVTTFLLTFFRLTYEVTASITASSYSNPIGLVNKAPL